MFLLPARLLGIALIALACTPAQAAEILVEGAVRSAEGIGVPGARVELRPVVSRYEAGLTELEGRSEPAPVAQAATDRMGRFRLRLPQAGLWRLLAVADGFVPMEISVLPVLEEARVPQVTLRSDSGLRVRVVDLDGNPVPGAQVLGKTGKPALWGISDWQPVRRPTVPLRLTAAVPVAGRIVDAAGRRPLAGALVWSAGDPGSVTRTDAAGIYRLAGRVSGSRLDLRAAAAGHQPGQLKVGLSSRSSETVRQAPDLLLVAAPVLAIAGVVVDEAARPVAGAEIRLVRPDPEDDLQTEESPLVRTSPDGSFRIAPLQAGGLYGLTASRPGFAPATLIVAVPLPPRSRPPVRLALTRGRTVFGRVVDPRQQPIPGVTVKLEQPESPFEVKPERGPFGAATDAGGRFRIEGLPAGVFELHIDGPELAPLPVQAISVPKETGPLDLGTFMLAGRARITGWIVDPSGRPVEGVEIWVVPEESTMTLQAVRNAGAATVTGRDGRFELRDRSVGDHEKLRACRKGFLPAEFQAQSPAATEPRVALTPSTQIAGRVVNPGGDPVPGAQVSASLSSGPARIDLILPDPPCPFKSSEITDTEGAFTLELQGPGRYDVIARGAGYIAGGLDHALVPAEGLDGVEIRMDDGMVVAGHVSDPEGHSIAGASISLTGSGSSGKTSSDSGGDFLLEGVAAGARLLIEHPDFQPAEMEVRIPQAGTRLNLVLTPVARLEARGRVTDPDGAPVEGAVVSSYITKTATSADGSFVLRVNKGTEELVVEKEGFATAALDVLVENRSLDGLEIRLGHGLTLRGRVLGIDPVAVTGSSIWVQTQDGHETLFPIDSAGRFEVHNLPPGEWNLSARAGERRALERFTPPPGPTEVVHDLEFAPVSEVGGRVTGPEGESIAGASLQLANGFGTEFHTQTLADGSFAVEVPDGTYTLSASAEGYSGRKNQPVEVAGAPVGDVQIQLGTDIVLSGRLLGLEAGDMLKDLQVLGPPVYQTGHWTVDQEARYRHTGLWPGDWRVSAVFQLGYQERSASGDVHIPSGATEAALDLDFHIGDLTLTVRSTTSAGTLDPYLYNVDGSDIVQREPAAGGYLFSHLRAGTYRLNCRKGEKRQDQLVELTADQELVIDPNGP